MNPCEGFLDVLSFNGGGELEDKFTSIYWTMKKDLRTPQKKAAFNKVCSNLGKDAPAWVMHIIQIFCATSAITNSDNLVRFEVEGSVDRFIAYVLNYATVHQLTTVDETRPELESFRKIVSGVIRSQAAGSSHSSADSRNLDKLPPEREVNAASIEEYADDFDDEQQATAPPSRPRAPPVMKRQMSVKGMANNPATPVRQEDSSVYEEYEDDFEKNNHSSVFSDQGHAEIPYAGRVAEPVESSNEYADDFVGSALSLPGAGQNGGSVAEYADDFDGGNSEIVTPADTSPASMGRPDGSVGRDSASVNYGADFEGGNSTEELQVPRDAPAVQADNSVMNEYADDFDGGDITAAAEGVEDAHDEEGYFVVTAGAGMVPPGEPLTRDNSDATFMRILQAPVEMALLDRDDSETTFLKNFQNFEEQNKESFEGIDRSAMPVVDAAESDPSMSRHNSERSFLGEFDNFHYKFKSEFDDTAAANAEKNRNIAVQPSYEGDDGFGEFSAAVAVTTPKSMGASVPGLSRFNSERSGGMSSTHPAPLDHTDGLSAEGASVVSAKKLKKTISFVQNVEYNDEDLTIGSKRFEPDVIDAANETQEYKADLEDIIGNMYVNSYMNANTSNEKQILFVEQVVYEDDDLYIGSNEFVKAKNEKDNKAVAGGEKIGLRSGSPASRPPARSIPAVGKILPAKPIAGSTISSSKPAPLPSMKVKESSAASTSKRPVSAQSTRSDAPVPLSSHSILQDPETLKVIRNGIEFDMIVPKKQAPIPLVSNVRPLSSPSRRMESRSAAKKTTSILVRSSPIARPQTAPAPRQPTYTGNIKKPAERAGESNSSLSLQGHEDRFAIKVVRRAAQPLDTGLRRSKSPVKIGANEKAQPPCIDITKVRVRNADDLFELLRRKLGEAARMIGDADIMWRKRLEEALKTQQDYWMDGKVIRLCCLTYRRLMLQ